MLNIRGMIALSAVSPVVIATAMSLILAACAPPQSRFRGPVNLSGSGAPPVGPLSTDPTTPDKSGTETVFTQDELDAAEIQTQIELANTDSFETIAFARSQLKNVSVGIDSQMKLTVTLESKKEGQTPRVFEGDLTGILTESAPRADLTAAKGNSTKDLKAYATLSSESSIEGQKTQTRNVIIYVESLDKKNAVKLDIHSKVEMNQSVKNVEPIDKGKFKEIPGDLNITATTVVSKIDASPELSGFATVLNFTTSDGPTELRFSGPLTEGSTLQVSQKGKPSESEARLEKKSSSSNVVPGLVMSLKAGEENPFWAVGSDTELMTLISSEASPGNDDSSQVDSVGNTTAIVSPIATGSSTDSPSNPATQGNSPTAADEAKNPASSSAKPGGLIEDRLHIYTVEYDANGKEQAYVLQDRALVNSKWCLANEIKLDFVDYGWFWNDYMTQSDPNQDVQGRKFAFSFFGLGREIFGTTKSGKTIDYGRDDARTTIENCPKEVKQEFNKMFEAPTPDEEKKDSKEMELETPYSALRG